MKRINIKCRKIFGRESNYRRAELCKISKINSAANDLSADISLSRDELRNITGGSGGGANSGASIGSIIGHITPGLASLWSNLQHQLHNV